MDAKKQAKLINEVWSIVTKTDSWDFDSEVNAYSKGILLDSPLLKKWLTSPISKIIGKAPDFTSDIDISEDEFENKLKTVISDIGYSDCVFDHPENDHFYNINTIIRYHDQEVCINYDPDKKKNKYLIRFNSIVPELRIKEFPNASSYYHNMFPLPAFNVKALLDFLDNGINEFVEEFKFKFDYLKLFWENFIKLPFDYQITAFTNGSVDTCKLAKSFFGYLYTEKWPIDIKSKSIENQSPRLPSAKEVSYNPENEFIKPFKEHYEKYVDNQASIDINIDPDCSSAFYVTINERSVYIRFCENHHFVYIDPQKMKLIQEINKFVGDWKCLIGDVVAGLNNADRFERFYDALSKIGEELHLDYDYTIDRWLHIPDKEEEWPTCWK